MAMPRCSRQSILSLATLILSTTVFSRQDPELLHHFDYDQRLPLDLREVGVEQFR